MIAKRGEFAAFFFDCLNSEQAIEISRHLRRAGITGTTITAEGIIVADDEQSAQYVVNIAVALGYLPPSFRRRGDLKPTQES